MRQASEHPLPAILVVPRAAFEVVAREDDARAVHVSVEPDHVEVAVLVDC